MSPPQRSKKQKATKTPIDQSKYHYAIGDLVLVMPHMLDNQGIPQTERTDDNCALGIVVFRWKGSLYRFYQVFLPGSSCQIAVTAFNLDSP